jgi:hypothetical protein
MANTHTTLTSLFTAIADKIRTKTGSTETIVADNFPDAIDSILTPTDGTIVTNSASDITISGKMVSIPAGYYKNAVAKMIPVSTQATPTISVSSAGLITASVNQLAGYIEGGTKSNKKQLSTQAAKTITPSTSSQTAVAKGKYTTGDVTVAAVPTQTKSATPSTSEQTIAPDSGKFLSSVTVSAMTTATQATPSISVDSAGLITASSTQTAGYVSAGTKSATKQLTVQAAKTITPSTSSQTAVASGRYTTGAVTVAAIPSTYVKPTATKAATTYTPTTSNQTIAAGTYCSGTQTIKGDSNLISDNIKNGVSIFGVDGTYAPVSDVPATQWSSKYLKTLYPTLSNTTAAITVKAMTYYDGYWYGIGNDSAGDAWKLYGTTTGNMTAYKCGSSRNYPVTGIVCDGTNVWLALSSGGYSNRVLLYQSIANFRSNSTSLYTMTSTANSYSGAFQYDSSYSLAYGVNTSTGNATFALISSSDTKVSQSTGYSSVPEALVSGCTYKSTAVAVTSGGYIMQSSSVASMSYYAAQLSVLNGAQKCCVMGDYLCVACVRDSATYLCFTSDDNVRTGTWNCFKVADSALTVVGMAYANGLYTLVTKDSANGTTTTVWQTTDIKDHGLYGQTISLDDGYSARAMASGGNYICLLADNGSTVQKALVTIDNNDAVPQGGWQIYEFSTNTSYHSSNSMISSATYSNEKLSFTFTKNVSEIWLISLYAYYDDDDGTSNFYSVSPDFHELSSGKEWGFDLTNNGWVCARNLEPEDITYNGATAIINDPPIGSGADNYYGYVAVKFSN